MSDNTVWPDSLMIRDTKLYDDLGGMGQRIYTTAGNGYKKQKYVRADRIEAQALEIAAMKIQLRMKAPKLDVSDLEAEIDRLRAAVTALAAIVQRDRELIGECDEYRSERDAALRLADEAMGTEAKR